MNQKERDRLTEAFTWLQETRGSRGFATGHGLVVVDGYSYYTAMGTIGDLIGNSNARRIEEEVRIAIDASRGEACMAAKPVLERILRWWKKNSLASAKLGAKP